MTIKRATPHAAIRDRFDAAIAIAIGWFFIIVTLAIGAWILAIAIGDVAVRVLVPIAQMMAGTGR